MIIATAGHVDHGKTLLVKALTGIDTDRLPDEKRRGLTIDLGFAYMPLEGGKTIGFIDVPGHERFIRNALCGLAGTDFVLLIVAADDGPMPQTLEHLAIVDLFGIPHGAVALTKTDRVDADRIQDVSDHITELLVATKLAGAPVFPVSAVTGAGIDELRAHLIDQAIATEQRASAHGFRLAVDRKFDVTGAGLVVTGTVFSGTVQVGDTVGVLGSDMALRVRGIHAQNTKAEAGYAGQRCALNLSGGELRKDLITRGDWIVARGTPGPYSKLDAEVQVLGSEARPLAHWTPVHVHLGAAETTGRVALLEGKSIAPGESGLAQLVLDEPIGAVFGDRLILRDQSAQRTMGGGRIIDVFPPRRGRAKPGRISWIRAMAADGDRQALARLLAVSENGVDIDRFRQNRNLTASQLATIIDGLKLRTVATQAGTLAFSQLRWTGVRDAVLERLGEWHAASPDAVGLGANRVLEGTSIRVSRETAAAIAGELVSEGVLVREGLGVRLPSHEAALQGADAALWTALGETLERTGLRPVTAREIAKDINAELRHIESFLVRAGRLGLVARISKNRYATAEMLQRLGSVAEELATRSDDGQIMVTDFRDASGIGRNMAIEVLEYFDKLKFTQREGEGRRILQPADKAFAGR